MFQLGRTSKTSPAHLHHAVPGAVVSQVSEAADEALAGLAVDSARLQHGLALFHKLGNHKRTLFFSSGFVRIHFRCCPNGEKPRCRVPGSSAFLPFVVLIVDYLCA